MKPILVETVLDALEIVRGKYPDYSIHKEGSVNEWRFYLDSTCQDCVAVLTKNKKGRWKLEGKELPDLNKIRKQQKERTCLLCSQPFDPHKVHDYIYCSNECRRQALNEFIRIMFQK